MARTQRAALALRSGDAGQPGTRRVAGHAVTTADVLRMRPDLAAYVRRLEWALRRSRRSGCQFKGIDLGLVDFPARIDGKTVLLCWQYGEKQIAFWHRADEGFAGRRALGAVERPQPAVGATHARRCEGCILARARRLARRSRLLLVRRRAEHLRRAAARDGRTGHRRDLSALLRARRRGRERRAVAALALRAAARGARVVQRRA